MSCNINHVIPQIHLNTMMSCAEKAYKQQKPEFLQAAIEHLNQYPLTPEQNHRIKAILENIASGNFEKTFTQPLPICQMMDHKAFRLPNETWVHLYSFLDVQSCHALSVIDRQFHLFSQHYVLKYLPKVVESVKFIDAGYGTLPTLCKLKMIKLVEKTDLESLEKFTCLIMRQGFTFGDLMQIGRSHGIGFSVPEKIQNFLETQSIKTPYPVFISNNELEHGFSLVDDEERQTCLMQKGYELPTLLELFSFRLLNGAHIETTCTFAPSPPSIRDDLNEVIMVSLSNNIDENSQLRLSMKITTFSGTIFGTHTKLK